MKYLTTAKKYGQKPLFKSAAIPAALLISMAGSVMLAGGTGTEFDGVAATLTDWAEGGLGRVFAILFFMIGMAVGLARQSLFAAVTGLGAALVVSLGPTVINGIVTAGIPLV